MSLQRKIRSGKVFIFAKSTIIVKGENKIKLQRQPYDINRPPATPEIYISTTTTMSDSDIVVNRIIVGIFICIYTLLSKHETVVPVNEGY